MNLQFNNSLQEIELMNYIFHKYQSEGKINPILAKNLEAEIISRYMRAYKKDCLEKIIEVEKKKELYLSKQKVK